MPLYDLRCDEGHCFERVIPLARFEDQQRCECGAGASRMICAPRVKSDSIEPTYGPDGRLHTSLASYRHACSPEGNARGEQYNEIGNEELPEFKAPEFDRKKRREAIKAGMQDVKAGRLPEVVTGDIT